MKYSHQEHQAEPNKWDLRFLSLANLVASWSEDNSRKVGAVIVGQDHEVVSVGFNGFPRSVRSDVEHRHSREHGEKYFWFEHAERNAIYNAARVGVALRGCAIYVSLFPCADCVRAIIQSGIVAVNTFNPPEDDGYYQRSFEVSLEMMLEAEVNVRLFRQLVVT